MDWEDYNYEQEPAAGGGSKLRTYFEGDTLKPFFDRLLSVGLI